MKVAAIVFGSIVMGCSGARATRGAPTYCKLKPVPSTAPVPPLRAGDYRLTLVADCGQRQGSTAEGTLTLVRASATDRSSTTGAVVRDLRGLPQFYGWTPLNSDRVGAAVCNDDGPEPPATSQDPMLPGVLVLPKNRAGELVIVIGTLSNLRTGALYLDGCGIGLHVNDWDGTCYRGTWGSWGIERGGSGTFRACPLPEATAM